MGENRRKETLEKLEQLSDEILEIGNKLREEVMGINILCGAGYNGGADKDNCLFAIERIGEHCLESINDKILDSFERQIFKIRDLME